MTEATFCKGNAFNWTFAYIFRSLVHYQCGREIGGMHGAKAVAESYIFIHRHGGGKRD